MKIKRCILVMLVSFCMKLFAGELIIPYEVNNKTGFLNENLEVIHYPEFDGIKLCFENQCIAYSKDFQGKTREFVVNSEKTFEKPQNADKCIIIGKDFYGFIYGFYNLPEAKNDIVTTVVYSNKSYEKIIFNNMELKSALSDECIEFEDMLCWPRVNYTDLKCNKLFNEDESLHLIFFDKDLNRGVITKDYKDYLVD